MRKTHLLVLASFAVVVWIGLSGYRNNQAINTVQSKIMPFEDSPKTVQDWLADVAGVRGSVQWTAFSPKGYESSVTAVQANIASPQGDVQNTAIIQWLVNTDTGHFEARYVAINGTAESVIVGFTKLQMWSLSVLGNN